MKKINHVVLLLFILTIVHSNEASAARQENKNMLGNALVKFGVSFPSAASFSVTQKFKFPAGNKTYETIIAEYKKTRIEIEIVKPVQESEFKSYSQSKYIIMQSLFRPQIVPYSGAITNTSDCPESQKPKEIEVEILGAPKKALLVNAGQRFVIGACDDESIRYKVIFVIFFDKRNSTQWQLMIFQPIETFNLDEVFNMLKGFKYL